MNRGSLQRANVGGAMVKAVTRKSRAFQTLGEKSYSLDAHETRLRERLLVINRFEDARLERLQRQIRSSEQANIGRIFRRKDQMRVSLIDIASTKRKLQSNVGDFERRLKDGTNSPVFTKELDRVRRKKEELMGLHQRLQAPNSQLLAAHLRDELRGIESRLDASPSRLNPTQPPSVAGSYPPVKPENEQETQSSLPVSNNMQSSEQTDTMPARNETEERLKDVHAKMSRTNISLPKSPPHTQHHLDRNFPVTQQSEPVLAQARLASHPEAADEVPIPNSDGELTQVVSEHNVVPVEMPVRELPPLKDGKTKKQRYLSLMQHKLARTSQAQHDRGISTSALQRERHARKRVAELRAKTRDDIQGRRTVDSTDDSLGSIKLQEAVVKLQTARTGPILPSVGEEPEKIHGSKRRRNPRPSLARREQGLTATTTTDSAPQTAVKLPPLRIDVGLLKELKESRLRHRHQSQKLPKLP